MATGKKQQKGIKIGWGAALEDAKRKHADGLSYVRRMRAIIRGINRKIENGEDFPGQKNPVRPDLT
jgi:hypothetical protein